MWHVLVVCSMSSGLLACVCPLLTYVPLKQFRVGVVNNSKVTLARKTGAHFILMTKNNIWKESTFSSDTGYQLIAPQNCEYFSCDQVTKEIFVVEVLVRLFFHVKKRRKKTDG